MIYAPLTLLHCNIISGTIRINRHMHTILRHMKDQNKKVANLKHNQQIEKKKNAQLLEEVRRREDNMTDNSQHLQVSDFYASNIAWEYQ